MLDAGGSAPRQDLTFLRAFYDTAYAGAYDAAALAGTDCAPWWRTGDPRVLAALDAYAASVGRGSFERVVAEVPAYPPPGFARSGDQGPIAVDYTDEGVPHLQSPFVHKRGVYWSIV